MSERSSCILTPLTKLLLTMADSNAAAPKPSSSVKLVLLGEAAVGKVRNPCVKSDAYTWRQKVFAQRYGTQAVADDSPCSLHLCYGL